MMMYDNADIWEILEDTYLERESALEEVREELALLAEEEEKNQ